jgi:hypothetical protein
MPFENWKVDFTEVKPFRGDKDTSLFLSAVTQGGFRLTPPHTQRKHER